MFLVLGVLLLLAAAGGMLAARQQQRRQDVLSEVPRYDCTQIATLGEESPGMRVELAGVAGAPASGPYTSPITQTPCVWYRVVTQEHRRERTRDADGEERWQDTTREVGREESPLPFLLTDETGVVAIEPADATIDKPRKTADRTDHSLTSSSATLSVGPLSVSVNDGARLSHTEEIIPVGASLYVLGGAYAQQGRGVVRKPREGTYLISTRSEQELLHSAAKWSRLWRLGAMAAGGLGILSLLIGAIIG